MSNGNEARVRPSRLGSLARGTKWLVPVAALAAVALSLLRLNVTPQGWLTETICASASEIARFTPDPVACIALASVVLLYWSAKERKEAAALAGTLAGWVAGVPLTGAIVNLIVTGVAAMFETFKKMVYEKIRADARADFHDEVHAEVRAEVNDELRTEIRQEADEEWSAWLRRRTQTGVFVDDEDDPPPIRPAG